MRTDLHDGKLHVEGVVETAEGSEEFSGWMALLGVLEAAASAVQPDMVVGLPTR